MNDKKNLRFVYNVKQADFFLQNGLVPIKIDTHFTTRKVFLVFEICEKMDEVFDKWMNRRKHDE